MVRQRYLGHVQRVPRIDMLYWCMERGLRARRAMLSALGQLMEGRTRCKVVGAMTHDPGTTDGKGIRRHLIFILE